MDKSYKVEITGITLPDTENAELLFDTAMMVGIALTLQTLRSIGHIKNKDCVVTKIESEITDEPEITDEMRLKFARASCGAETAHLKAMKKKGDKKAIKSSKQRLVQEKRYLSELEGK